MTENKTYTIPIAIVIAGLLIAGALYTTKHPSSSIKNKATVSDAALVPPVSSSDHILGSPEASVIIVEYSDFECPYCKNFHSVLQQIVKEYGPSEKVAWVYRHFPIAQLHSKAPKEAVASECAAELGGNQGFWDFANELYHTTPSDNGFDLSKLPVIASSVGLDPVAFQACLDSGRHEDTVTQQYDDVIAAGGRGTPHNIIIVGDQQAPIEGAQSLETMRRVIETLLDTSGTQTIPAASTSQ